MAFWVHLPAKLIFSFIERFEDAFYFLLGQSNARVCNGYFNETGNFLIIDLFLELFLDYRSPDFNRTL